MSVVDSELPDEDRLEALKAMFFSVNKVNATDAEKILAYQLFQIAKRLNSAELIVLKATFELYSAQTFGPDGFRDYMGWEEGVTQKLGCPLVGLVQLAEEALAKNGLLTPRVPGTPTKYEPRMLGSPVSFRQACVTTVNSPVTFVEPRTNGRGRAV